MSRQLRLYFLLAGFILLTVLIISRLFYWQVIRFEELVAMGENQYWVSFKIPAQRGQILAADKFPIVNNEEAFLIYATLPDIDQDRLSVAKRLTSALKGKDDPGYLETIKQRLNQENLVWVALARKVSLPTKRLVEQLAISGLGFESEYKRGYPEGSMAAHLLGFVGSDVNGEDKGYHGLEGFYDLPLRGEPGYLRREKDATGKPILTGQVREKKRHDGANLLTTLDRAIQYIVEKRLSDGLNRYGAKSGSVVVMEPQSGKILALAAYPNYDPTSFWEFTQAFFVNPVVAMSFEPGSIFKVIVMAAALNEGVVKPETVCDMCGGPRTISDYTIETWNGRYPANPTMTEVIEQSNNVGIVFVGEKLGIDRAFSYIKNFGFGETTGVDLQEESSPSLRPKSQWGLIDLATVSFGQGIAVTPIQMVRAVAAIANGGRLMKPYVVDRIEQDGAPIVISPKVEAEVIKPVTAKIMTEMMVNAVEKGEAKWAAPLGYRIAGKTGTAQIPISGHYDEEKTIASFVGFAPADNPKFIMLVTLREPTSSPWGSETAAPLWFDIAKELFTYFGVRPDS